MGLCPDSGKKEAARARADEAARQGRIQAGTAAIDTAFGGFDNSFYDQRAKDYEAAALPEVNQQFTRTRNSLGYALANRGLLNSSVRDQRTQSLAEELAKQKRIVADSGLSQANDLRASVEDSRNRVYGQLLSSADPVQATQAANRAAAGIVQPSPVGALGQVFNDWSQIYLADNLARANNVSQPFSFGGTNTGSSGRLVKG